jgi:hypothetical protein
MLGTGHGGGRRRGRRDAAERDAEPAPWTAGRANSAQASNDGLVPGSFDSGDGGLAATSCRAGRSTSAAAATGGGDAGSIDVGGGGGGDDWG